jgi:5S rRNA maturation endonuclease (ribonuclease M5)
MTRMGVKLTPLQMVVNALSDVGSSPRPSGSGYSARCPSHDDTTPSLSVSAGENGRVLIHCQAGRPVDSVIAALNLTMADLFPPKMDGSKASIEAVYDYTDEDRSLLFQVVRMRPKRFWQRRPDGNGGWISSLGETRRVLFRLPEVVEAVATGRTVWIVEGEKDVLALVAAGECATTNPMGAGKWSDEYAKVLVGASEVIIVTDLDDSGRSHAQQVADSLRDQVGRLSSSSRSMARTRPSISEAVSPWTSLPSSMTVKPATGIPSTRLMT